MSSAITLNEREMKHVVGGTYNVYGGAAICAASQLSYFDPINFCSKDPDEAKAWAGDTGWWGCNCSEAIAACATKLGY